MTDAYAGIDVAVAKGKRLPLAVCAWRGGRLEPLALRGAAPLLPPTMPGNERILDQSVRQRLAIECVEYLRQLESRFGVRLRRIAIDAPSAPRPDDVPLRAAEAALDRAGISYIQTPNVSTFARIPADVDEYVRDRSSRNGLPHANRIWMLFGFDLFRVLTSAGWECLEVYPQATVRVLGVGIASKKTPQGLREQLAAAAEHTKWPKSVGPSALADIGFGSRDDRLDAYLSAWVASLPVECRRPFGVPPDDVIWVPRVN